MKRRSSSFWGVNRIPETSSFSQGTPIPLRATRSSTSAQRKKKLDYTSETKKIVKKSKTTSENYTSDKDEFDMHLHVVKDTENGKNAHEMMVEAGEEAPPPNVTLATQQSTSDESDDISETGSAATGPSHHQPNVAYLEYHNVDMNKSEATSLCQSLNIDVKMTRIEEIMETVKRDLAVLKGDFAELKGDLAELKRCMDAILQVYGIDPVTLQPMDPSATPPKNTISGTSRPIP